MLFVLEVTIGFEPMDNGVADRGLTTWLRHHINQPLSFENDLYIILLPFRVHTYKNSGTTIPCVPDSGADYGARTRHLRLGKATLYQMS